MSEKNIAIEDEAIALVKREKTEWETGTAFITEKVAFNMRNLIRQLRKNYWGIFDQPIDPQTGRKKIWIPLTESMVESAVKNIDLDTKDINFRSRNPENAQLTTLVRHKVKNELDEIYFGEYLDEMERQIAIDGTAVWKTVKVMKDGKQTFQLTNVDLLNFYIDPTARSIQDTPAVIERAVLTLDELKSMNGWINTEDVEGDNNINKNDGEFTYGSANTNGETKLAEVFERWGLMPKSFITGKEKDKNEYIEGHIVVSNLSKNARVHLIEENKAKTKPYEEAWYTRVAGRWYGKGVAEKVMMLQLWMNIIVNIRITRSLVSQLGLFKIKKGSGITPQMLSRLAVNGAIQVGDQDDIEQMVVQEASQASYNDEQSIQTWAERVTSAFEAVTGESMPASTTATIGAIQSKNAQSQFVLIKEGIGMFLQRWIKRHLLKILKITKGDVINIIGNDPEELRAIDEKIADYLLINKANELKGFGADEQMYGEFLMGLENQKTNILQGLKNGGQQRFITLENDIPLAEFEPEVYITNEEIDKSVITNNLITVLNAAPEYKDQIMTNLFDIMGLDLKPPKPILGMDMMMGTGQAPSQNPMQPLTNANTMQGMNMM